MVVKLEFKDLREKSILDDVKNFYLDNEILVVEYEDKVEYYPTKNLLYWYSRVESKEEKSKLFKKNKDDRIKSYKMDLSNINMYNNCFNGKFKVNVSKIMLNKHYNIKELVCNYIIDDIEEMENNLGTDKLYKKIDEMNIIDNFDGDGSDLIKEIKKETMMLKDEVNIHEKDKEKLRIFYNIILYIKFIYRKSKLYI